MPSEHTDDLWNVVDGDKLRITTTNGDTLIAECFQRRTDHADPRSGEVREMNIWEFVDQDGHTIYATVTNGLKSSPDDPDFPKHTELWDDDTEESIGYIEELKLSGKMVE